MQIIASAEAHIYCVPTLAAITQKLLQSQRSQLEMPLVYKSDGLTKNRLIGKKIVNLLQRQNNNRYIQSTLNPNVKYDLHRIKQDDSFLVRKRGIIQFLCIFMLLF